ncbi:ABC transporter permease [Arthrobacter crystallopoietes]|uniref:ABC transporter permease n=1 Tax=Crystallibacter crystallopoietes TaxID=37928 RepID=UPI0011115FA9|nr:ABC transporter permease [Arthrobacter crystallopoietes]
MTDTDVRPQPLKVKTPRQWSAALPKLPAVLMVAPLVIVALLFIVYPLVKLGIDSFTRGDGGFSNYISVFESAAIRNSLVSTLMMSAVVTVLCLLLGGSLAWALTKPGKPILKTLLWTAVLLPFWMGVVVKTYAWAVLLAKNGLINTVLVEIGLVDEPLTLLYTPLAVVLGMTYTMLPYAVLAMYPTMAGFDKELLNSASVLGSSRTGAMYKIWLPMVRPGLVAGGAIVFAISIGFYITPVLLGGAQTPFMATVIGDDIFAFFNYPRAAASSVILLVIALTVLIVTLKLVGAKALKGGLGK